MRLQNKLIAIVAALEVGVLSLTAFVQSKPVIFSSTTSIVCIAANVNVWMKLWIAQREMEMREVKEHLKKT